MVAADDACNFEHAMHGAQALRAQGLRTLHGMPMNNGSACRMQTCHLCTSNTCQLCRCVLLCAGQHACMVPSMQPCMLHCSMHCCPQCTFSIAYLHTKFLLSAGSFLQHPCAGVMQVLLEPKNEDILVRILQLLDHKDLLRCSSVSQQFRLAADKAISHVSCISMRIKDVSHSDSLSLEWLSQYPTLYPCTAKGLQ